MTEITEEVVLAALGRVIDPARGMDIVSAGMVKGVSVDGNTVRFIIEGDSWRGAALEPLRRAAEEAVAALPGVRHVAAILTAETGGTPSGKHAGAGPRPPGSHARRASPAFAGAPPDLRPNKAPNRVARGSNLSPGGMQDVRHVLAIGSGKGGVGKSSVTANLAVAMALAGWKVGVLDADLYGPSQPRMLGASGQPTTLDGVTMKPLVNHGVRLMSLGLLTGEEEAVIWRGPMLLNAMRQLLNQVAWGELDCLLVDLPPGTGDIQLTLSREAALTGAVIVSSPQDIALLDARKAMSMFVKLEVPVLGLIENMACFICDECGKRHPLFGSGGVREEAAARGLPFLGEIPLEMALREGADSGVPVVLSHPTSDAARAFSEIAAELMKTLEKGKLTR